MGSVLRRLALFSIFLPAPAAPQNLPDDSPSLIDDSTPPATDADRWHYYFRRTYTWQVLSGMAFNKGIHHLLGKPEWGRGIDGYACRYASGFGRRLVANSAEYGVSSLLHEDTRFRISDRIGVFPRVRYAVAHAFLAWNDENNLEPAWGRFASIGAAASIEPLWRKGGLTPSIVGQNIGFRAMDQVETSLFTEFSPDLRRLEQKVRQKIHRK